MILLIGSSGYIGKEFAEQLRVRNIPFKTTQFSAKSLTLPLLEYTFFKHPITYIINAAGYTGKPNVDVCETHKHDTLCGNVTLPQTLSIFCRNAGIPLGHVSSGCIFTGRNDKGQPFTESDHPNFTFKQNNCSFYSGTKALAEEIIQAVCPEHHIWRLRIPFEEIHNNRNYLSKLITYKKLLNAENSISNKKEFVNACIECIIKKVPYGIYNITNTGSVTTQYVVEKLKKTIAKNRKFEFFSDDNEFYKTEAIAPRSNCVLDNSKLLSYGIPMSTVDESLDYCLNNWRVI